MNKVAKRVKGQTMVIVAVASVALVGAVSLGTDVAVLYFHWVQLQKAADAATEAGANYLPDNPTQAIATANSYAETNGLSAAEITSTTVSADDLSITMNVRRQVPYYFARVLGLNTATIQAAATSSTTYAPSTVNSPTPLTGGDNNGANGTTCSSVGGCGLMPIGLDSHTSYTDGMQITLQQGQIGPGNWDLLALGATGGNNLRTNIANGYDSMISVGDWVTTEPGEKVGPVDQGFQDRLNQAATADPSGTYSSHALNNPRALILPMVNWEGQNGRNQVQVTGFATVWLDSYNGSQVTVHFISQVIANSYGDPNGPTTWGARGTPHLVK